MAIEALALQMGETDPIGSLFVFVISLLVGAVGIHLGAKLMIDRDVGYRRAIVAALVGAIVWAVVTFFFSWIPVLGPLLAVLAWIGVINWSYPGGWGTAALIGIVAWVAATVILYLLYSVGIIEITALGVPGA